MKELDIRRTDRLGYYEILIEPRFIESLIKHQLIEPGDYKFYYFVVSRYPLDRYELYVKPSAGSTGWFVSCYNTSEFTALECDTIKEAIEDLKHQLEVLKDALENSHALKLDI